jgi:two-component system sensor histidine kinase PilS (NtrC family)
MLFRVGLVTVLLAAVLTAELAAPVEQPTAPVMSALLGLIAFTYGLTILYALLLPRLPSLDLLAAAQIVVDVGSATALVHLTGGVESVFVFLYLLVVIGAASVLSTRGTVAATTGAVLLYAGIAAGRRWLPLFGQPLGSASGQEIARNIAVYAVAFAATGLLAARLARALTRAEARIASQHTRLRDLATLHADVIRCLTSGLITLTEDGRVVTFNNAAAEMVGLSPQDAVGHTVAEVLPALSPLLEALPPDGTARREEVTHRSRVFGVTVTPLLDADRHVLGRIVNFTDLTELRRMQEVLLRNERLAAVGRLAAGVAHEIRNPLAAISGSIELLQAGADRESTELMGIVQREVARLNTLITELLEFARPRRPDPQRLDVGAALQEMLRVFENDKRLAGARVELSAPQQVWVDADAGQLRQVVWNLLRNAAEASPGGQPISVEVSAENGAPRWARITVRDHGPGISMEHRLRLFEPFFSTKDGGTGLGLATVHRIVEDHKGRIEVDAPPDGGTTFTVRLPLS